MNALANIGEDMGQLYREFGERLSDPWWRLTSGELYKIMTKEGAVVPFIPNEHQLKFLREMWFRNLILKARQAGYTTVACIYNLDHVAFVPDQRALIIAHDEKAVKAIFRDKVHFAYDNLPAPLRERMPLARDSAEELLFGHNNSSIAVALSGRSGTFHRVHVSEMGKIAARFPERAREVQSGTLPAVPQDGVATIESTAEGIGTVFHEQSNIAKAKAESGTPLGKRDYRFHFLPWWKVAEYRTDPSTVIISAKDHEYFDQIENELGIKLDLRQRAWYIATRDGAEMAGDVVLMWREYPSTPEEAWRQSSAGAYYTREIALARVQGRICRLPVVSNVPVNTFWDIGVRDGMGIWLHQQIGPEHRFLRYIEGWGEPYATFIKALDETGHIWGKHFLPHDALNEHADVHRVWTPLSVLEEAKPGWKFEIVPRVQDLLHGIHAVRSVFNQCWFDEEGCKEGLQRLAGYRKRWNSTVGAFMDEPVKDINTEGADSFRQFAQVMQDTPNINRPASNPRTWRDPVRRRIS